MSDFEKATCEGRLLYESADTEPLVIHYEYRGDLSEVEVYVSRVETPEGYPIVVDCFDEAVQHHLKMQAEKAAAKRIRQIAVATRRSF